MQRITTLLLQLTIWVSAVRAFYPFVPEDLCDPGEKCSSFTVKLVKGTSKVSKKVSNYYVSKPNPPTAPNSAGVYQNGPDYSYFVQAEIGSEKEPFYMLIDTGAPNTWVMSAECPSPACRLHSNFNPSTSTTFKADNKKFHIAYGTGEVAGTLGSDTITVAGLSVGMAFGVATSAHDDFKHFAFDGILGLAMGESITGNFLRSLKSNNLVEKLMFAVTLNRDSDGVNDGQITFGGVDKSKFTGEISYSSVPSPQKEKGEWTILMDGVGFNGKSAGINSTLAAIDTGTSFIFAPPDDVAALFKLVPGATPYENSIYVEYKVPCNTHPITMTFAGVTYQIPTKDWLAGSGEKCLSRIYGLKGASSWLVGDVFLKNVYSVFDADNMRIGFATKVQPPKPTTTAVDITVSVISTGLPDDGSSRPVMPGTSEASEMTAPAEITATPTEQPVQASAHRLGSSLFALAACALAVIAVL